jgi:Transcriptional regulators
MLSKLPRATLAEQAARNLLAFIEAQKLMPGTLLPPESQLAADLGVSRPIIREALKSLEGRGVITVLSGKGAMIKPLDSEPLQTFFERAIQLDSETIIDLLELRTSLEVQSASLAAQRRSSDELEELAQIVQQMREHIHIPERYVELDIAFHRQVAHMAHNSMIYWLVTAIRDALTDALQETTLRQQPDERFEQVQQGHEAILEALRQADPIAAEQAMSAHFEDAVISLLRSANKNA